jgi:hypothetical protein
MGTFDCARISYAGGTKVPLSEAKFSPELVNRLLEQSWRNFSELIGIGFVIRLRIPFPKRAERIILDSILMRLRENHAITVNLIDKLITLPEMESCTNGPWNCRLGFGGQAAGNHPLPLCKNIPYRKEYSYKIQGCFALLS